MISTQAVTVKDTLVFRVSYSRSYYGSGYYGRGVPWWVCLRSVWLSQCWRSLSPPVLVDLRTPFFAPQTALGLITSSKAALHQAQAKRSYE
jgi:hypothetical protein